MFIPTNLILDLSIALPSPPRLTILLMSYQVLRASTKIPCLKEALLLLLVGGGRKRGIYLFLFLLLLILPSSLPPCLLRKGGGGRGGGGGKRIPLKNLCSSSSRPDFVVVAVVSEREIPILEEGARLPPPPSGFQPPPQTSSVSPPPPPPSFSMKSPQAAAGFSILRDSKYWTLPPSRIPRHIWVSLFPGPLLLLLLPSVPLLPRRPLWSNYAGRDLEEEEEEEEEGPEFANFVVLGNGAAELLEKGKRFSFIGALKKYADIFVIIFQSLSALIQPASYQGPHGFYSSTLWPYCCVIRSFVVGFPTLWPGTDTNLWDREEQEEERSLSPLQCNIYRLSLLPPLSLTFPMPPPPPPRKRRRRSKEKSQ